MSTSKRQAQARRGSNAGLTLIELLMFLVIVSIAAIALLRVFSVTVKSSADPQMRKQALILAEGFLEEVQLARFTYCEPTLDASADDAVARPNPAACSAVENVGQEVGSVGRPYDNVNDYVRNFGVDTAAFNNGVQLQDAAGVDINLPGYSVTLAIRPEALNGIAANATPAGMEVLRITVTVTYNNGQDSITLDGYRTRYAPYAIP
mgnify:CR=1 FL=1